MADRPDDSPAPRRALPPLDDEPETPEDSAQPANAVPNPDRPPGAPTEEKQEALVRPSRPPIVPKQAKVIETTNPGRIQSASERFWGVAVIFGTLAFITAWIVRNAAVRALLLQAPEGPSREEAVGILHTIALAITGVGLVAEALLLAFLRRRGIANRIFLSILALLSVALLPLALGIMLPASWLRFVITIGLAMHAVFAVLGSVLMWLPIGRRRRPT